MAGRPTAESIISESHCEALVVAFDVGERQEMTRECFELDRRFLA